MCGYVPFALLKKYRALGKEEFVLGIESMRAEPSARERVGPSDKWIKRIDRRSLFHVTYDVFQCFVRLEQSVVRNLPRRLSRNVGNIGGFLVELKKREDVYNK